MAIDSIMWPIMWMLNRYSWYALSGPLVTQTSISMPSTQNTVRWIGQRSPRRRRRRTPARYRKRPKPAATSQSTSKSQAVNQRSSVSSGGSVAPVRICAGRLGEGGDLAGGRRRARERGGRSRGRGPSARPRTARGARTSRPPAGLRAGGSDVRDTRRPSSPMPPSSTTLASTIQPYGVAHRASQPPTATIDRVTPEKATTAKAAIASDE